MNFKFPIRNHILFLFLGVVSTDFTLAQEKTTAKSDLMQAAQTLVIKQAEYSEGSAQLQKLSLNIEFQGITATMITKIDSLNFSEEYFFCTHQDPVLSSVSCSESGTGISFLNDDTNPNLDSIVINKVIQIAEDQFKTDIAPLNLINSLKFKINNKMIQFYFIWSHNTSNYPIQNLLECKMNSTKESGWFCSWKEILN